MHRGDYIRALDVAQFAVSLDPHSPLNRRDRGIAHYKLGNVVKAIDDLRFYLALAPDGPDVGRVRALVAELRDFPRRLNVAPSLSAGTFARQKLIGSLARASEGSGSASHRQQPLRDGVHDETQNLKSSSAKQTFCVRPENDGTPSVPCLAL